MLIEVLKSKIHKASITGANLNYIGSISIDEDLIDAANLIENEKVHVLDLNNGERLETYVIKGERGSDSWRCYYNYVVCDTRLRRGKIIQTDYYLSRYKYK